MSEKQNSLEKMRQVSQPEKPHADLMNEFLMTQSEEIQRRVRETVRIWGIKESDPYFLILIQCEITHILHELLPGEIQKAYTHGNSELIKVIETHQEKLLKELNDDLKSYEATALNVSTAKLNTAIAKVLEDNNISQNKGWLTPRVAGSVVTLGAVILSTVTGFLLRGVFNGSAVAENLQTEQEIKDQMLIDWVNSDEGKLAQNLFKWNDDLLNRECEKKVQSLEIAFRSGSAEIQSGFCVLFTVPANERKIVNK